VLASDRTRSRGSGRVGWSDRAQRAGEPIQQGRATEPRLKPLAAAFRDVQFQVDVRRVHPLSLKLTRLGGATLLDGLARALRTIAPTDAA